MDFIDDHHPEIAEKLSLIDTLRDEHHLKRLRRRHQKLSRLPQEALPRALTRIAVPNKAPKPNHLGIEPEPIFLVIEESFDGRDIDHAHAPRRLLDHHR